MGAALAGQPGAPPDPVEAALAQMSRNRGWVGLSPNAQYQQRSRWRHAAGEPHSKQRCVMRANTHNHPVRGGWQASAGPKVFHMRHPFSGQDAEVGPSEQDRAEVCGTTVQRCHRKLARGKLSAVELECAVHLLGDQLPLLAERVLAHGDGIAVEQDAVELFSPAIVGRVLFAIVPDERPVLRACMGVGTLSAKPGEGGAKRKPSGQIPAMRRCGLTVSWHHLEYQH